MLQNIKTEKKLTNRFKSLPNMPRIILSYQRYDKRHIIIGQELVIDKAISTLKGLFYIRET